MDRDMELRTCLERLCGAPGAAGLTGAAETAAAMLKEYDPKARIILVDYEPVTGSHVGPGALAMFYVAKEPWSSAIC